MNIHYDVYYQSAHYAHQFKSRGIKGIQRWIKYDLYSKRVTLVPTKIKDMHWILIGVDIPKKTIFQHDSYGNYDEDSINLIAKIILQRENMSGYGRHATTIIVRFTKVIKRVRNYRSGRHCGLMI